MERTLIKSEETKQLRSTQNHCLELFIERITKDLLQTSTSTRSKLPDNLPPETRKALDEMRKWKEVVIRPADKGSKYFFLDRSDYVKRVRDHLYDSETFETVSKDEAENQVKQAIIDWTSEYSEEEGMTDKIFNWVTPDDFCKPGNNYVNPKAHKPEKNYPGRLISTGCASAIKNLSALTSHELTKVQLQYAIRDTNHFLQKIEELNESGMLHNKTVIHASFDIEAMFPSISKDMGMEQCRKHLDKRENPIFSTDCIVKALEITLDNNITVFENEAFRQIKGTAMGPKNACAYADTAIDRIDREVLEGGWPHEPPILWARFRDDIYVPWTLGSEMLDQFLEWLNSIIPGIRFTLKASVEGTEFLDTFVYMKANTLHTKPYSKPCDDHAFVIPSSCHPDHTLRNIPYSTALRIYKIASDPEDYAQAKAQYTHYLEARGYSTKVIHEAFSKVESKPRNRYFWKDLDSKEEADRVFPLVTDFNPGLPNIGKILNKHKHIIELDQALTKVINPKGIFASFRGAKTIHDMLVHSKLTPAQEQHENVMETAVGGCEPCAKRCDLCKNFLKVTNTAYSFHTNSVFNINQKLDCDSKNVIYIINDTVCKLSSVGCTSDSMKVRFRNHKSHIKNKRRTCEVSCHFIDNESTHVLDKSSIKSFNDSLKSQLEVVIIEQVDVSNVNDDSKSRLKECKGREWYWMNQLKTLRQYGGMNIREERNT